MTEPEPEPETETEPDPFTWEGMLALLVAQGVKHNVSEAYAAQIAAGLGLPWVYPIPKNRRWDRQNLAVDLARRLRAKERKENA